jgi:hypothetical protein
VFGVKLDGGGHTTNGVESRIVANRFGTVTVNDAACNAIGHASLGCKSVVAPIVGHN